MAVVGATMVGVTGGSAGAQVAPGSGRSSGGSDTVRIAVDQAALDAGSVALSGAVKWTGAELSSSFWRSCTHADPGSPPGWVAYAEPWHGDAEGQPVAHTDLGERASIAFSFKGLDPNGLYKVVVQYGGSDDPLPQYEAPALRLSPPPSRVLTGYTPGSAGLGSCEYLDTTHHNEVQRVDATVAQKPGLMKSFYLGSPRAPGRGAQHAGVAGVFGREQTIMSSVPAAGGRIDLDLGSPLDTPAAFKAPPVYDAQGDGGSGADFDVSRTPHVLLPNGVRLATAHAVTPLYAEAIRVGTAEPAATASTTRVAPNSVTVWTERSMVSGNVDDDSSECGPHTYDGIPPQQPNGSNTVRATYRFSGPGIVAGERYAFSLLYPYLNDGQDVSHGITDCSANAGNQKTVNITLTGQPGGKAVASSVSMTGCPTSSLGLPGETPCHDPSSYAVGSAVAGPGGITVEVVADVLPNYWKALDVFGAPLTGNELTQNGSYQVPNGVRAVPIGRTPSSSGAPRSTTTTTSEPSGSSNSGQTRGRAPANLRPQLGLRPPGGAPPPPPVSRPAPARPSVSSVSPSPVPAGQYLVVSGSHFGSSEGRGVLELAQGGCVWRYGPGDALGVTPGAWRDGQITVRAPTLQQDGSTGRGDCALAVGRPMSVTVAQNALRSLPGRGARLVVIAPVPAGVRHLAQEVGASGAKSVRPA